MQGDMRIRKLRWMCRRGMQELDILFKRFLDRQQSSILDGGWPQLESFLQEEDDLIWAWIQGTQIPDNPSYRELIGALFERA